jgi:hypothetical protein
VEIGDEIKETVFEIMMTKATCCLLLYGVCECVLRRRGEGGQMRAGRDPFRLGFSTRPRTPLRVTPDYPAHGSSPALWRVTLCSGTSLLASMSLTLTGTTSTVVLW